MASKVNVSDTSSLGLSSSYAPFPVYNIGNHQPVELMTFIETIENALGKKAIKNMLPMQHGDVVAAFVEKKDLREVIGLSPSISLSKGVGKFIDWYLDYHGAHRS